MVIEFPERAAHPLVALVDDLSDLLASVADAPAWSLTATELTEVLPRLARVENQLAAVRLRMLAEADRLQVGDPVGAASTAGWWAHQTGVTKAAAHRQVALAGRLDDDTHGVTSGALAAGGLTVEQAAVILDAVDALPDELVSASVRADAEEHLVALAQHHDPKDLRILGRKVLDVLAPEIGEEHERRVLEAEEQHAAATAMFSMRPDGHGSYLGRFKIPELAGAILAKHLDALASPQHRAATTPSDAHPDVEPVETPRSPDVEPVETPTADPTHRVARPLRLGTAFVEYLETRRDTPKVGGLAATVVVTMTMHDLLGTADRAATLDTGGSISAAEARRLACEAGIIPAVLGSKSQPLDLGRKTRFHTEPQRIALALKHRGCAEKHCDWPPGRCHAHHTTPWSKGGPTTVHDGLLLCPRHHTLAHDRRYQLKTDSGGRVTFSRRT